MEYSLRSRLAAAAVFGGVAFIYLCCWGSLSHGRLGEKIPWLLMVVALPAAISGLIFGEKLREHAAGRSAASGLWTGIGVTFVAYFLCWVIEWMLGGPLDRLGNHDISTLDDFLFGFLVGVPLCLLPALPFGMSAGFIFYRIAHGMMEREGEPA